VPRTLAGSGHSHTIVKGDQPVDVLVVETLVGPFLPEAIFGSGNHD
jgi:hypothetical protein